MKLTPTLGGSYSGSIGGITASHNRGGQYLRRRSVPTDPSSAAQNVVRAALADLTQRWFNVLTPEQRLTWETYAANVSWTDSLGQTIQLQGLNMYLRTNVLCYQSEEWNIGHTLVTAIPLFDDAPAIYNLGFTPVVDQGPTATMLEIVAGPPTEANLTVTWDPDDLTANDFVFLFVSPAVNATRNFWKGPFFLTTVMPGDANGGGASVVQLELGTQTPYAARFPEPVVGQAVHGYLRVMASDGRLSRRTYFGPIVAEAAA